MSNQGPGLTEVRMRVRRVLPRRPATQPWIVGIGTLHNRADLLTSATVLAYTVTRASPPVEHSIAKGGSKYRWAPML